MATRDVTVKVIDSSEDNQPGEVKILNRQPEVATALVAELDDPDGGVRGAQWQWYRYTGTTAFGTRCGDYNPFADGATDTFRNFVADPLVRPDGRRIIPDDPTAVTQATVTNDTAGWVKIDGATRSSYTPHYDTRAGGTVVYQDADGTALDPNVPPSTPTVHRESWTGGDIEVVLVKTPQSGAGYRISSYVSWAEPKCLRATVMYQDGAKDRTHRGTNDNGTAVNETLEGTFMGSEYSVKQIDEENDRPVFTDDGMDSGNKVSTYRAEIPEDARATGTDATTLATGTDPKDLLIHEAFPATDPMVGEDDDTGATPVGPGPDVLTYSLSGPDAESFVIVGSIEHPVSYDPNAAADDPPATTTAGSLFIKASLDYDDYGGTRVPKREYRVTITATDPSGDSESVNVIVNVTPVNERPKWSMPGKAAETVRYPENGTAPVFTFKAADPEDAGIGYALVGAAPTGTITDTIAVGAFEDHQLFTIDPISGALMFKPHPDGRARPNYEMPEDVDTGDLTTNNEYQVAVRAKAVNPSTVDASITTIYRAITVIVTDVPERPVFSRDTNTLEIKENADDPEKEPPAADGFLYLLNRGVGIPGTTPPEEPNLDVGAPVLAADDDNTGNFAIGGYTDTTRDRVDGLTYELMGTDAGPFHIVPATGQILTREKLDYETKKTYSVTVKATDPSGLYDSIPLTIKVTDVDEAPVGGLLTLIGEASHTYAENDKDTVLGIYTASGATGVATWTLEGADASHFMLECTADPCPNPDTIRSRNLKFKKVADYEMPRGEAISNTNTNTYMVTVKVSAGGGGMKTVDVEVMVTNVEEAGSVTLSATGGKVGTPLTATLMDDDIAKEPIEWLWSRVDPTTNGTLAITGARSASYTPVVADVGNLLMVTATYTDGYDSNNTASASTKTPVADANAAPEFAAATMMVEVAENSVAGINIGDPFMATDPNGDVITYGVSGADAASFDIDEDTGQLMTMAPLNYEDKSSYSIAVTAADPEGATGSIAVTVNITNVNEAGMVSLSPSQPSIGTAITASVTDPDRTPTGVTWQWSRSTAMDGSFAAYPGETTATFTPAEADEDRYLRVTVIYNDGFGAQTLMRTTGMVVQNAAPMFASATTTRSVAENTDSGTAIGDPVTATDADNHTLSYTLSGADAMHFGINASTGQLMTMSALDYETKRSYMVTVMATDPYGAYARTRVTIMVTDVDEQPITPPDPNAALIARYDTNGTPGIQKDEVITAINDYLFGTGAQAITKAQVIVLINLYLFG